MEFLTKEDALSRLGRLVGKDLRRFADEYGVTVFKGGKLNKGWAGHTLERYLGLGLSSLQAPNGGSWELKVVPLNRQKDGGVKPKETMAITMINAKDVMETPFEESHLLMKLQELIICGRVFESKREERSILHSVGTFDLNSEETFKQVKKDYELVRETLRTEEFSALTGEMGILVQPRTKGPGHGSTSRAFYARPHFVAEILGISTP